jgi:Tfp pilus assembly protein PilZ
MTDEKRRHGRVPLVMEVTWEGSGLKSSARTTDISVTGCFIDTLGQASVGETLNLQFKLNESESISVQGKVMYHQPGVGFGVLFTKISDDERFRLDALLAGQ